MKWHAADAITLRAVSGRNTTGSVPVCDCSEWTGKLKLAARHLLPTWRCYRYSIPGWHAVRMCCISRGNNTTHVG